MTANAWTKKIEQNQFTIRTEDFTSRSIAIQKKTSEIDLKLANRPHAVIDVQLVCNFVIALARPQDLQISVVFLKSRFDEISLL